MKNKMKLFSMLSLSLVASAAAVAGPLRADQSSYQVNGKTFVQELDPKQAEQATLQALIAQGLVPAGTTIEELEDMEASPEEVQRGLVAENIIDLATENGLFVPVGPGDLIDIKVHRESRPQYAEIFLNGNFVHSYWVSTGAPGRGTPTFSSKAVYEKNWNRTSRAYGGTMTGALMFSGGYGVHMTPFLGKLGSPASHGCVRMEDAGIYKIWELAQGTSNSNIRVSILAGNIPGNQPAGKAPYQGGKLQSIASREGRPAGGKNGASERSAPVAKKSAKKAR